MPIYAEEYVILDLHYGIEIKPKYPEHQVYLDGRPIGDPFGQPEAARRFIQDDAEARLKIDIANIDRTRGEKMLTLTDLIKKVGRVGPRTNNLILFMVGQPEARIIRLEVDIQMRYHFDACGASPIVEVIAAPHPEYVGRMHMYGLPIDTFGVPTETGRRYRLTIEELPDSKPQPVENPWRKGEFA